MDTQEYISSGIIEAYVMGVATEEESRILECIQQHNQEVKQAVLDAQIALEGLVSSQAVAPPAELKHSIWSAIQQETAVDAEETTRPPVKSESDADRTIPFSPDYSDRVATPSGNRFKPYAIAASVLLVISVGVGINAYRKQTQLENQLAQLKDENQKEQVKYAELLNKWDMSSNPDMNTIVLEGVEKHPGMKAMVYVNKVTRETYLSLENLPAAPEGHQYQLWAIVDGKPVDAGVYSNHPETSVQKMAVIENAQAFAITLEKEGGSVNPTLEQMYVMGAAV